MDEDESLINATFICFFCITDVGALGDVWFFVRRNYEHI